MADLSTDLGLRTLGRADYESTVAAMRDFTAARHDDTADELWLVEHPPVFTQGQAGKTEYVHDPGDIPVVQANRGGQVTYHGPGQAVVYVLVDLHRRGYGIRSLVTRIERAMANTLANYGIAAYARPDAPGVYVTRTDWPEGDGREETRKIGSLGLRVSRGCSYHGLALNVDMDLEPFTRIDPCGLVGMRMTQIAELAPARDLATVWADLASQLGAHLAAGPDSP